MDKRASRYQESGEDVIVLRTQRQVIRAACQYNKGGSQPDAAVMERREQGRWQSQSAGVRRWIKSASAAQGEYRRMPSSTAFRAINGLVADLTQFAGRETKRLFEKLWQKVSPMSAMLN